MSKFISALSVVLVCLSSMVAMANDTLKIQTVQEIYHEATILTKQGQGYGSSLNPKYATTSFANALKRQEKYAETVGDDYYLLGLDGVISFDDVNCVESWPSLVEGNGLALDNKHTSYFYMDDKGRVVADLTFMSDDGYAAYMSIAFDLVCDGNTCRVDDVVYLTGEESSVKSAINQYCR